MIFANVCGKWGMGVWEACGAWGACGVLGDMEGIGAYGIVLVNFLDL